MLLYLLLVESATDDDGPTSASVIAGLCRVWWWCSDGSDSVATSSDDIEKRDVADNGDKQDSSLMLAENMHAEQTEQKPRAKRDLDADDIRELFKSQNAPLDDYYTPGILLGSFPCHVRDE